MYHPIPRHWQCRHLQIPLGQATKIMAILNATPDSFSGDGLSTATPETLTARITAMAHAGAHILDIGGESTRPGFIPISADEESRRIQHLLLLCHTHSSLPLSIDTTKRAVAEIALCAGAVIINDISGLKHDPTLARLAADTGAGLILGRFTTYPIHQPIPDNSPTPLITRVRQELEQSIERALRAGIHQEQIVLDPCFGFNLQPHQSAEVLLHLHELLSLGFPLLIGISRKGFTGYPDHLPPHERHWATAAAHTLAIEHGASILRLHDVEAAVRIARFTDFVTRRSTSTHA